MTACALFVNNVKYLCPYVLLLIEDVALDHVSSDLTQDKTASSVQAS